ncbi:transposase [Eubacteriales bacterium mix99]
MERAKSRRKTPWEGTENMTATQKFLQGRYIASYESRHQKVADSCEAEMINSHIPAKCPYCGAEGFKKSGHTRSGVQRYMCICGKTFLPTTGTIFDEHRIPISEWTDYCLNLFHHVSITADSWNNKNAFRTSRYWLQKLFLTLEGVQDGVVLSGDIWLDETFYSVRAEDMVRKDNGDKLRGLSMNQLCIGVATDKKNSVVLLEGTGKPSQKRTFEAFGEHIRQGSLLIHDGDTSHSRLIKKLSLKSVVHPSKSLKGMPDNVNPMNPVNRVHAILKNFLNSHSGFKHEDIQGYLNLFAFVTNPPAELLEKVERVINLGFQNPRLLRYREFYATNTDVET